MHVISVRNVTEALPRGLDYLCNYGERKPSRAGEVLASPVPVTTVYSNPCERVLTAPARDANPFFHLVEALWMLAGRSDAELLNTYVSDFGARFAEQDGTLHGAYGARWRSGFGFDQLEAIVDRLRRDPHDRQAVLQMWDCGPVHKDLSMIPWRDRPCNTHAYFRLRGKLLDMTVCCRSNDAVWGAYGANAVHFSFLQEYIAAALGARVGTYYQISNNFHVYLDVLDQIRSRLGDDTLYVTSYNTSLPEPVVHDAGTFLDDAARLLDGELYTSGENPWLVTTARRVMTAHEYYRIGDYDAALAEAARVESVDWGVACYEWIQRRHERSGRVAEVRDA